MSEADAEGIYEIRDSLAEDLRNKGKEDKLSHGFAIFERETEKTIHDNVINKKIRIDGRKIDQLRDISCEVNVVPEFTEPDYSAEVKLKSCHF